MAVLPSPMRQLCQCAVGLLISACLGGHELVPLDPRLQHKDGLLLFESQPFTGSLIERYADGSQRRRSPYRQGLLHGEETHWHPNGLVARRRLYEHGHKVGTHQGWDENGKLRYAYHFVADQHHGDFFEWYPNGQIYRYRRFDKGREVGQKIWRRDGKIYANYLHTPNGPQGLRGGKLCFTVKGKDDAQRPLD